MHKCDGCKYKGEHQEMMFRPFGVCLKETDLIRAEKIYNAEKCPYGYSKKKYKIDVWQYGALRESYESDNIEDVADWYKENWLCAYEYGLCAIEIYEDGESYPFNEALKLGFY